MITPENVSRRDMLLLGLAGIGTLATTACAGNFTEQTSPSNIQTPTEIPTRIRIPSASELLSDREMRALTQWKIPFVVTDGVILSDDEEIVS